MKRLIEGLLCEQRGAWRRPTPAELRHEFESEFVIQKMFGAGNLYPGQWNFELDLFLAMARQADQRKVVLTGDMDLYWYEDLGALERGIKHMGKDVQSIARTLQDGERPLPMPIFAQDKKLEILGGRTRASVARLLGVEVVGVVLQMAEVRKQLAVIRRKRFLEMGSGLFKFASVADRQLVLDWLDGGKRGAVGALAQRTMLIDDAQLWADEIASLERFLKGF